METAKQKENSLKGYTFFSTPNENSQKPISKVHSDIAHT